MASVIEKWARAYDKGLGAVSRWGNWIAIAFLAIMLVLNGYEVIARYVFSHPSRFMDEILTYLNIGLIFLALGWAWRMKGHINVDVVVSRLPGRWNTGFRLGGLVLSFAILVAVVWSLFLYEKHAIVSGARSFTELAMPRWLPMIMVLLGVTLYCLEMLATTVKEIKSSFSRKKSG